MMIVISRIESVFNDSDPAGDPERAALTLRTTVFEAAGLILWDFSVGLIRRGELLALPLGLVVSRCDCFRWPGKSSGPPPFAPSLNVQGDDAHNSSGLAVISRHQSASSFPRSCAWRWAQLCSE